MNHQRAFIRRAAVIVTTLSLLSISLFAQQPVAMQEIGKFNGTNGSSPVSDLIQLPNGNFLGVTLPPPGYPNTAGTIYQLSANGVIQVLYRLAVDGSQGKTPNGYEYDGVVQASDGKIYGVMNQTSQPGNFGIIYRFTLPSGPFEVLYSFTNGDPINGSGVQGKLVQALDGNLYGQTTTDGANKTGTIFRVGLDGSFATVTSFPLLGNINTSAAGLTAHPNGLLYGVRPDGPLFSFDPSSGLVTSVAPNPPVFYEGYPPVVGTDGGLYVLGVANKTCGACAGALLRYGTDGSGPTVEFVVPQSVSGLDGSLLQVSDGSFVGTNASQLFQIDPTKQSLTIYEIPNMIGKSIAGNVTQGGLSVAASQVGGKTRLGGVFGLFNLLPKPLPSVLGFYPSIVPEGATVSILGNSFVGVQSVSINGQTLSFTVKASGAISVTAPATPITAPVMITSPAGTITSTQFLTVQ